MTGRQAGAVSGSWKLRRLLLGQTRRRRRRGNAVRTVWGPGGAGQGALLRGPRRGGRRLSEVASESRARPWGGGCGPPPPPPGARVEPAQGKLFWARSGGWKGPRVPPEHAAPCCGSDLLRPLCPRRSRPPPLSRTWPAPLKSRDTGLSAGSGARGLRGARTGIPASELLRRVSHSS